MLPPVSFFPFFLLLCYQSFVLFDLVACSPFGGSCCTGGHVTFHIPPLMSLWAHQRKQKHLIEFEAKNGSNIREHSATAAGVVKLLYRAVKSSELAVFEWFGFAFNSLWFSKSAPSCLNKRFFPTLSANRIDLIKAEQVGLSVRFSWKWNSWCRDLLYCHERVGTGWLTC